MAKVERRYTGRPADPNTGKSKAGRPGRSPDDVQRVMLRMGKDFVEKLDFLCKRNERSRREIVEFLIDDAFYEAKGDPAARITPL